MSRIRRPLFSKLLLYLSFGVCSLVAMMHLYTRLRTLGPILLLCLFVTGHTRHGAGQTQGGRRARPWWRCGETTRFTHLQLIQAAFVAVLETRCAGSTWLQRKREKCELRFKNTEI